MDNHNQNAVENSKTLATSIKDLRQDLTNFLQTRYQLLMAEINEKARKIKTALPLFAVAVIFALLSLLLLTGALVYVISLSVGIGWSLLLVGGAYLIIAALCGWLGYAEISQGVAPQRTLDVLKQDQMWLQQEARSA